MLCLGPREKFILKSTTLNSIFGINFEVLSTGSIGLLHDSVEIMFDSKEFPSGFNIFDFQGYANNDDILLEGLLQTLPYSLILL